MVFAANLRYGREVVDELGLSKSNTVSSPASGDGVARYQDDESKPLDEEEKRLYQRIIVKFNDLAHDRLDLKCAISCLANASSSPSTGDMRAAKRVALYLRDSSDRFMAQDRRAGSSERSSANRVQRVTRPLCTEPL